MKKWRSCVAYVMERRRLRLILGLACIPAGAIPPYVRYSLADSGDFINVSFFMEMLWESAASFAIFSLANLIPRLEVRIAVGVIGSYAVFWAHYFLSSAAAGYLDEAIMWSYVMVLFSIPYVAPLVGLAWLGSTLVFGRSKRQEAQQLR